MKATILSVISVTVIILAACHSTKKTTSVATEKTTTTNAPAGPMLITKSADGIYEPGENELKAIKTNYADATLDQLKFGHQLYTAGACVNCHKAKSIYAFNEAQWSSIISDMAFRARLNEAGKDAVIKYVMAIKATQVK
ncbi:MAG: hypothetical protein K0S32_3938 [Bacteroidetes bacterium]|jgi:hypothetical protein|nr:hypothetical protein [Bacteroidota bacterium]